MGQEISQQQNKCNTCKRQQQPLPQHQQQHQQQQLPLFQQQNQQQQQHQQHEKHKKNYQKSSFPNNSASCSIPKPRYKQHKELTYTSSSISNASSTDDELYRQRQKYNLAKQTYEKVKIAKSQLGSRKSLDSHSSTSDYPSSTFETAEELYRGIRRKSSQSSDSGIYYSSCHCTPTRFSSAASSVASGCSTSVVSTKSTKSLQKQKDYLDHHLYIKSYLDILEEDQKAKAQYKVAKPGGIRNYTPKILAEVNLSTSAPAANGFSKQKTKIKDDPWI